MREVRADRAAYQNGDIIYVGWISSSQHLADGFTKYDKSQPLVEFIASGSPATQVEQCGIREDVDADASKD